MSNDLAVEPKHLRVLVTFIKQGKRLPGRLEIGSDLVYSLDEETDQRYMTLVPHGEVNFGDYFMISVDESHRVVGKFVESSPYHG